MAIAYGPGWQYDESDGLLRILPASVQERAGVPVPATALTSVAPNPLSRQTRIRFQLREPTRMRLSIRDVSGRTIAVLADDVLKAGYYCREWALSPSISPGVYFLQFAAGDCVETRKLTRVASSE